MRPPLVPLLLLVAAGCHRTESPPPPDDPLKRPGPVGAWNMPGSIGVPLIQTKAGFLQVEVEIGPERFILLIDTGSQADVLDCKVVAERLKLPVRGTPIKAGGIESTSMTQHIVAIPPLKIGPFTSVPGEVRVMDLSHVNENFAHLGSHVDGILGAPFFIKYGAVIDYPRKQMLLYDLAREGDAKK